ncbi:MAG: DegT/DnrJ/EryC1/StrS family aminotransferase [Promethearchaeota archaeon]
MDIPLFKIGWDEDDITAISEIIRSGKYWCIGSEIEELEKKIANYIGLSHCILLNSGGSALDALMNAYGFKKGDEIIVPSFTFIASAYAPIYAGASPVFADIEEQTFGLDVDDVSSKISSSTKAILPIHYGGMPCKIDELKELAEEKGMILIEDAAESFGAMLEGRQTGSFGDSSIFSFCQNKVITTSEGGCVVTDNSEVNEAVRRFRSYGRIVSGDYFAGGAEVEYVEVGYNLRISTLLAGLGLSQLKRVDELIEMRRNNAQYLIERLSEIEDIITPTPPSKRFYAVYQMFTIRVKDGSRKRNELMDHLKSKGIDSKVYFDPVHKYSVFQNLGYGKADLPTTERISSQVLTLPMYPHMTDEELEYISKSVIEFF